MFIVDTTGPTRHPRDVEPAQARALVASGSAEHVGVFLASARCARAVDDASREATRAREVAHEALRSALASSRSMAEKERGDLQRSPARTRSLVAVEALLFQRARLERGDVLPSVDAEQADDLEVRGLAVDPRRARIDLQRVERDLSAHESFASTIVAIDAALASTRHRLEVQRDAEADAAIEEAEAEVAADRDRREADALARREAAEAAAVAALEAPK